MTIPETVTIPLPDLQRAALHHLLERAPADYNLHELLELILVKGLRSLLGEAFELDATMPLGELRQHDARSGRTARPMADYLGFPIREEQQRALDELLQAHPDVGEEELCRTLLDRGLQSIADQPQTCSAVETSETKNSSDAEGS